MFVSSRELGLYLNQLLDRLDVRSLCLHTDLVAVGPLDHRRTRSDLIETYARTVLSAVEERPFLLPVFNYAYPKTRVYDVQNDPCEVGVLNEHFRRSPESRRNRTPVFNFCVLNDRNCYFNMEALPDPFSPRSIFAQMAESGTWMGFFGASLKSISFVHYVEHVVDVGYRYYKGFPGKVVDGKSITPIDFGYKVRVLHPDFLNVNDWEKIDRDMTRSGVLHKYPLGHGELLLFKCDEAFSFWYEALSRDDLYVFTSEARRSIEALGKRTGYPFTLEMFEALQ